MMAFNPLPVDLSGNNQADASGIMSGPISVVEVLHPYERGFAVPAG